LVQVVLVVQQVVVQVAIQSLQLPQLQLVVAEEMFPQAQQQVVLAVVEQEQAIYQAEQIFLFQEEQAHQDKATMVVQVSILLATGLEVEVVEPARLVLLLLLVVLAVVVMVLLIILLGVRLQVQDKTLVEQGITLEAVEVVDTQAQAVVLV
jgi:hypothetical protein